MSRADFQWELDIQHPVDVMDYWLDPEYGSWLDRLEVQRKIELRIYLEAPEEF